MPAIPPKLLATFRRKYAKAGQEERTRLRQAFTRRLAQNVRRGRMTPVEAATLKASMRYMAPKQTKKVGVLKKAKKIVYAADTVSLNLLRKVKRFLAKSVDAYNSNTMDAKERDALDILLTEVATSVLSYMEDHKDARDPDYAELYDDTFMYENISEYIRIFHDYYSDLIRKFMKRPTEDTEIVLRGLTQQVADVLRRHVGEPTTMNMTMNSPAATPAAAPAPAVVKDELDDLLSSIGTMRI